MKELFPDMEEYIPDASEKLKNKAIHQNLFLRKRKHKWSFMFQEIRSTEVCNSHFNQGMMDLTRFAQSFIKTESAVFQVEV
jgi:hypothetical protein